MIRIKGKVVPRFVLLAKPYFTSERKWVAWGLMSLLVALMLTNTAANVLIVRTTGEFTTALAERDSERYWRSIYFSIGLLAVAVPIYGSYYFVRDRLALHWRTWMTETYLGRYLSQLAYYKLTYAQYIDNPDQRIADDINSFTTRSIYFLLLLVETVLQLCAFSGMLWFISKPLVLVLLVYSFIGTVAAILLFGRPLVGLNFFQLRKEADFRFSLVRLRENAESIAFYSGEPQELQTLHDRFAQVSSNYTRLISRQFFLNIFQYGFVTTSAVLPGIILAPRVLSGELEVGRITEATGAFAAVFSAMNIVVDKFDVLSLFAAGVGRLDRFAKALDHVVPGDDLVPDTIPDEDPLPEIATQEAGQIAFENITLHTPDRKRQLVKDLSLSLQDGDALMVVGASGGGKSSILRALAGLWKSGEGTVHRPSHDQILFLPQRPYMLIGTLRDQLLYPTQRTDLTDEDFQRVLEQVGLPHLIERCGGLDMTSDWGKVLSLGEQQRLAIARVLLAGRPFVILDEATSALDEEHEARVYELLQSAPVTIISVSHRPQVARFHTHVLRLKGDEGWDVVTSEEYLAGLMTSDAVAT